MGKAIAKIKELDGQVDAMGLGGIDLYFYANGRRYVLRDALKMKRAAVKTPIVDGSGLKNTLERRAVEYLENELKFDLRGRKVLMVAGVDRFGMAEAFDQAGADILFGDLIFGLGIPVLLRGMKAFRIVARILLPIVTLLPISVLYPTGKEQEKAPDQKYVKYFRDAEIIAGDFIFILRYMPEDLRGKIILTNTVTSENIAELKRRGLAMLITTTPEFNGRSFGTNVMEATFLSLLGRTNDEARPEEYLSMLDKLDWKPRVVKMDDSVE